MSLSLADTGLARPNLKEAFTSGRPFPLLVVDDFLPQSVVKGVIEEIAAYTEFQKSNDYIFAKNKFESPDIEKLGPNGAAIKALLLSPEMAQTLSTIYGRTIFVDRDFVGGGLHRGGDGSYLDMHADFNLHPLNQRWIRELNILLYLNEGWQPTYGGNLELRNAQTDETASVEPRFNRLVLMQTKNFTLHGYKQINFPLGQFRTSIAAYAYSAAASDENLADLSTTTTWVPESGGPLKSIIAKFTPQLVTFKQRLLGSATARKK
jgi:Rps23 Pro-64 3,4-dihydroxylase Tpa1-like proline 4-hydroxylase